MKTISEEELMEKGCLHIKNLIDHNNDTIHVTHFNKPLFVVLSEKKYSDLMKKLFENEILLSEKQYREGKLIKGNKEELFSDLGI